MKIEFEEYAEWNESTRSIAHYGTFDGRPFGIAFPGKALAELFGVEYRPAVLESKFMRNRELMDEIARDVVEGGRLDAHRTAFLTIDDLRPYFERRAATAPA